MNANRFIESRLVGESTAASLWCERMHVDTAQIRGSFFRKSICVHLWLDLSFFYSRQFVSIRG